MLESDEPISKPLPCHQIWDEMLPVDGGRICTGCGKLVVDFRNHKWREIEQAQRESIVPLCGIYNPKQIENWGLELTQPISGCNRMVRLSATLLAFAQIAPGNLPAQTNSIQQYQVSASDQKTKQNPPSRAKTNTPPIKRVIRGTVVSEHTDQKKMPLPCVELTVVKGTKSITTETDSFGRFALDITSIYYKLPDTFEIVLTRQQQFTHSIKYSKRKLNSDEKLLDIILSDDLYVVAKKVQLRDLHPISFRAEYIPAIPSPTNKGQGSVPPQKESKFKKWWRHLWKKDKK